MITLRRVISKSVELRRFWRGVTSLWMKRLNKQSWGWWQFKKKLNASWLWGNWQKLALGVVLAIILLPVLVLVSYHLAYNNKVYPGVSVAGVNLGNRTRVEAEGRFKNWVEKTNIDQPAVTLKLDGNSWHILKAEINFSYLPAESAQAAFRVGRQGLVQDDLAAKWKAWFYGLDLPAAYGYETTALESKVASLAAELNIPPVPPSIEVLDRPTKSDSWVEVDVGEAGQLVDEAEVIKIINEKLAWAEPLEIDIPIKQVRLNITANQVEKTKQRAEMLIGKKLNLSSGEQTWSLEAQSLINFLDFTNGFDEAKILEYVETLAAAIDRPAQDAAFQWSAGRVTEFKPAKDGLALDQDKTVAAMVGKLTEMIGSENQVFALSLPIRHTKPKISLPQVNDLGINQLLGKGVSTYRGSIASRVHNIALSASRINGVLVPPGEEFSFNASVGEVSAATGYKSAYVIRSGATVLDDGGGVCQTSTTTFRAALDAGLPITQRKAHSYRVGYYEQNAKAGLDATVYAPSVDLKFLNDTPGHILVQTVVNTGSRTLTVEIYGTSDGREAKILNHRVWDIVPAPPPRYQDDPSLPAGTVKQIDWAAAGAKAKFDYVVTRNGETIFSKTFYSNFRPWQAVYLRGV